MRIHDFFFGFVLASIAASAGAESRNIEISAPTVPSHLPASKLPFPGFTYPCYPGPNAVCGLADFMARTRVCALAVLQRGELRLELYNAATATCHFDEAQNPNESPCPATRGEPQASNCRERLYELASVTKSITSTLMGMTLIDRAATMNENWRDLLGLYVADVVPELRSPPSSGAYSGVTLLQLLQMRSGNGVGRRKRLDEALYQEVVKADTGDRRFIVRFAARVWPQSFARGMFAYVNLDSVVLGAAADRLGPTRLSDRLRTQIWHTIGAEAKAKIRIDSAGVMAGACCMSARLRDVVRFARFVAERIKPAATGALADWLREATAHDNKEVPYRQDECRFGYRYQWWTVPGGEGRFLALGINGQIVHFFPKDDAVVVQIADWNAKKNEDHICESLLAHNAMIGALRR